MTATTTAGTGTTAPAARKTAAAPVQSTGNKKMDTLAKQLETIQIGSVGELHEFLEALRGLSTTLAVYTALAAGEAKANLTAAAKSDSRLNIPGFNSRMAIRRVTKDIERAADELADVAVAAVRAWTTFEKEFDTVLQNSPQAVRAKRTFTF